MKTIKFLAIVAMCSMTLAAAAATTAKAKIVIAATDNSTDVDNLYILEGDTYSDAFDDGKDAIKIMNDGANAINLYAVLGGNNLQMCYTNDISNLPLTFASGSATDYTMTFSNITGTVKLYDAPFLHQLCSLCSQNLPPLWCSAGVWQQGHDCEGAEHGWHCHLDC